MASYWHVRVGGSLVEDLVWSYPDPAHDAEPVRDMLCFFSERVDIELDGVVEERPQTQWSPSDAIRCGRAARPDGPPRRLNVNCGWVGRWREGPAGRRYTTVSVHFPCSPAREM